VEDLRKEVPLRRHMHKCLMYAIGG
jgi:hypothetical protein